MRCHNGSCHCGAVRITLNDEPAEASECNCSICSRLGSLWHYASPAQITVEGPLQGYVQGDRTLTTWRCQDCGCVTHWTALDPAYTRMGVNLRMFPRSLWIDLPRRHIDGASY